MRCVAMQLLKKEEGKKQKTCKLFSELNFLWLTNKQTHFSSSSFELLEVQVRTILVFGFTFGTVAIDWLTVSHIQYLQIVNVELLTVLFHCICCSSTFVFLFSTATRWWTSAYIPACSSVERLATAAFQRWMKINEIPRYTILTWI